MDSISIFSALGQQLNKLPQQPETPSFLARVAQNNPWFTPLEVQNCWEAWTNLLQPEKLNTWLKPYPPTQNPKKVGIIMAGNIPLVGLHDLLAVLASGHHAIVKPSSDDTLLLQQIIELLLNISPELEQRITLTERMHGIDALIATGSNNSSRYFEHYFKHIPHIIRKNRNSVAILTGRETAEELTALAEDIFSYYGLGCRSVSKLFVPKAYNFSQLFEQSEGFRERMNGNTRYANNLDYNLALLLVNRDPHLTNHLLILREAEGLGSPISVVFYEYYEQESALVNRIQRLDDQLQCVVGHPIHGINTIAFGQSQHPELWDYADGLNTLDFLVGL
mgnify:CR=1 FL=1